MAKIKAKATKKQREAFDKVIEAIKEAKKTGLCFFGKQWDLVAYTKAATEYENKHGIDKLTRHWGAGDTIPHLSERVLTDSGADDYSRFLKGDEAI